MRLNEARFERGNIYFFGNNSFSMDKLFDLMTMAVKYQFLLCKEPSELVLVTMNHLDGMKAIFKMHPNILEHIDFANTLVCPRG